MNTQELQTHLTRRTAYVYQIPRREFRAWTIRANCADRFTWSIVDVSDDGDTINVSMTGSLDAYEDAHRRAGEIVRGLVAHQPNAIDIAKIAEVDAALREVLTRIDPFWLRWSSWCERMRDEAKPPITISLDDDKTRAIWSGVKRSAAEVATWPASKRGEDGPASSSEDPTT